MFRERSPSFLYIKNKWNATDMLVKDRNQKGPNQEMNHLNKAHIETSTKEERNGKVFQTFFKLKMYHEKVDTEDLLSRGTSLI